MGNPISVSCVIFHVKPLGIAGKLGGRVGTGVKVIVGIGEDVTDRDGSGVSVGFGVEVGVFTARELHEINKIAKKENKNNFFKITSLKSDLGLAAQLCFKRNDSLKCPRAGYYTEQVRITPHIQIGKLYLPLLHKHKKAAQIKFCAAFYLDNDHGFQLLFDYENRALPTLNLFGLP